MLFVWTTKLLLYLGAANRGFKARESWVMALLAWPPTHPYCCSAMCFVCHNKSPRQHSGGRRLWRARASVSWWVKEEDRNSYIWHKLYPLSVLTMAAVTQQTALRDVNPFVPEGFNVSINTVFLLCRGSAQLQIIFVHICDTFDSLKW